MVLSPRLSYIRLRNAQGIESIELILDGGRYHIPKRGRDFFSQGFGEPLMFPTEKLSLLVGRKMSRFGFSSQTISESISINSIEILCRFRGKRVQKKGGEVSITLGVLSVTFGVMLHTQPVLRIEEMPLVQPAVRSVDSAMRPTTEELIRMCPRFRVLVVGKSGAGKSSLINHIFGMETASVARDRPGQADIEQEFTSPENDRLILHDSKGFGPACGGNYETVMSFIEKRKNMPDIKDQLHAVWLCFQVPIPTYGEWLLEDGAEMFLKSRKDILGNTPTIVVFTKHDRFVTFTRQKGRGDLESEKQYLQEYCIEPIQQFTGDKAIGYIAVSSKPGYERSLDELIRLTQEKVSESFSSPENQVSPVLLAAAGARRRLPMLKIDLSIDVGKQKYWRALGSSASFPGHTMQDCLGVIHTDIVVVWNYHDPCQYLYSDQFRNLMMNMVEKVDVQAGSTHQLSRSDSLPGGGVPHIALAPVMLPLRAFATPGGWVHETYQRLQCVPTKFMAYIVDLTNVLETLFALTAGMRAGKLTRRAIKLAFMAYYESEWMILTHTDIKSFQCWSTARDAVLDKITSMICSDDRETRVSTILERIPSVDLERDEEWVIS